MRGMKERERERPGARFTAPQITQLNGNTKENYIRPKRKRAPNVVREPVFTPPRAECNNPLDRLCEKLLEWDILTNNDEQPTFNVMKSVADSYESYSHYVSIWEPLLIAEIQASICSSFSLEESFGNCRAIPLNFDDRNSAIIKLQCSLGANNTNSGRSTPQTLSLVIFSTVSMFNPQIKSFNKTLPANSSYFLGVVINQIRGLEIHVSVSKKQFLRFLDQDSNAASQKSKYGTTRSPESPFILQLEYRMVSSLTSQWREYLALHEAYRSPLLPSILNPLFGTVGCGYTTPIIVPDNDEETRKSNSPSTPPSKIPKELGLELEIPETEVALGELFVETTHDEHIDPSSIIDHADQGNSLNNRWCMKGVGEAFNTYLHLKYNDSQLRAIRTCVEVTKGFSLIQGPPGTGKTSTILGLLNAVHIRDYNLYFEALLENILGPAGLECREKGLDPIPWVSLISSLSGSHAKPHLLVVAPSNVAVDNIIERIIDKGFRDSSGSLYYPNILRIGSGRSRKDTSSPCRSVTLDESVDGVLNSDGLNCHVIDNQLAGTIAATLQSILQLQTLLLNLKLCWNSHPLDRGWELRINPENGRPYWVDHINKRTQGTPPLPPTPGKQYFPDFTLQTLPEYKYYTHSIVQKLEELRLLHLRKVRIRVIMDWNDSHSTKINSSGTTYRTGNSLLSLRQSLETSFIEEADIVFTTLNSSGHPCLEGANFPVVIIDEAAQCVEPSILIPLRMGCSQCILVGDQQQLSATIFSKTLSQKGYDKSLFERLDSTRSAYGVGSVMLDTQYRMLPDISRFPSKKFYSGSLKDGENVKTPGYGPNFLGASQLEVNSSGVDSPFRLKPFLFFDLLSSQDCIRDSNSRSNIEEARLCVQLLKFLLSEAKRAQSSIGSIGIITPYQEQLNELKRLCDSTLHSRNSTSKSVVHQKEIQGSEIEEGELLDETEHEAAVLYEDLLELDQSVVVPEKSKEIEQNLDVELNTVDAFQGREKDIVVISCVRANDLGSIGFLSDTRRMNVAITRARFGLYIIGNAATLRNNKDWRDMIVYAESENRLITLQSSSQDISQSLATQIREPKPSNSIARVGKVIV